MRRCNADGVQESALEALDTTSVLSSSTLRSSAFSRAGASDGICGLERDEGVVGAIGVEDDTGVLGSVPSVGFSGKSYHVSSYYYRDNIINYMSLKE